MFHLGVINKKPANFHKTVVTTPNVHTHFYMYVYDRVIHVRVLNMKFTGAISKFGIT